MIIGLLDSAKRPAADGAYASNSLRFCQRVLPVGSADEARSALADLPHDAWIVLLRDNEGLADDAGEHIRLRCADASDAEAFRFRFVGSVGEQKIRHPFFSGHTGVRLARIASVSIDLESDGLVLQPAPHATCVDEERVIVHGRLATSVSSFAREILPRWPLPDIDGPAAALSELFNGLDPSGGSPESGTMTDQLACLVSLAVLQRRMVQGVFDQAPHLLGALSVFRGLSGYDALDRDQVVSDLRESHRMAMEHARHHVDRATRELADTRQQLDMAQQQLEAYGNSLIGRFTRWWVHRAPR